MTEQQHPTDARRAAPGQAADRLADPVQRDDVTDGSPAPSRRGRTSLGHGADESVDGTRDVQAVASTPKQIV
jgi:hypothetical protein